MSNDKLCDLHGTHQPCAWCEDETRNRSAPAPAAPLGARFLAGSPDFVADGYTDPSATDLEDPLFSAIWERIKTWDINVPTRYRGYMGATGNHVIAILSAIRAAGAPLGAGEALRAQIQGAADLAFELGADICSDHCDLDPDDQEKMAHCVWCNQAARIYQMLKEAAK